jgi:hypothetical protein
VFEVAYRGHNLLVEDDRQCLLKALPALRHGDVEPLEVDGDGASPHAELQAALAQEIHRGRVFGHTHGMLSWEQRHGCSQADALGSLRRRQDQQR